MVSFLQWLGRFLQRTADPLRGEGVDCVGMHPLPPRYLISRWHNPLVTAHTQQGYWKLIVLKKVWVVTEKV